MENSPQNSKHSAPQKANNSQVPQSIQIQSTTTYQSPIPPPSIMEGYARLDPTFPDRILKEFEKNSQHIRDCERTKLESTIQERRRGQYLAFVLAMGVLGIIGISIALGNFTLAGIGGLAFLILFVQAIVNPDSTKKNNENKPEDRQK